MFAVMSGNTCIGTINTLEGVSVKEPTLPLPDGFSIGDTCTDGVWEKKGFVQGIPQSVSMRQARLALLAAGKLNLVQPAIDALQEPNKSAAQIEWEYSNEVHRHQPFVTLMGTALGLDSAALDALFLAASKL